MKKLRKIVKKVCGVMLVQTIEDYKTVQDQERFVNLGKVKSLMLIHINQKAIEMVN